MTNSAQQCPIPGAHDAHENMKERPTWWTTGFIALVTVLYYSLPDVIKCRYKRFFLKTALLGAEVVWFVHMENEPTQNQPTQNQPTQNQPTQNGVRSLFCRKKKEEDYFGIDEPESADNRASKSMLIRCAGLSFGAIVAALAAVGVSIVATVACERFIFRRAQRRVAQGVRFAHTRQGLAISAAVTAFYAASTRFIK